jgi:hypothetical protein
VLCWSSTHVQLLWLVLRVNEPGKLWTTMHAYFFASHACIFVYICGTEFVWFCYDCLFKLLLALNSVLTSVFLNNMVTICRCICENCEKGLFASSTIWNKWVALGIFS